VFKEIVSDEFNELIDMNIDLYSKIKDDTDFGRLVKQMLLNNVYKTLVRKSKSVMIFDKVTSFLAFPTPWRKEIINI
jgi:hypothetical protein